MKHLVITDGRQSKGLMKARKDSAREASAKPTALELRTTKATEVTPGFGDEVKAPEDVIDMRA